MKMKRTLSLLVTAALLLSLMGFPALAEESIGYLDASGTTQYTDSYTVMTALNADGQAATADSLIVHFDPGEGSGEMADENAPKGLPYTVPPCGFSAPLGKIFAGWSYGTETLQPGGQLTAQENLTLTATYTGCTVILDPGEGSGEPAVYVSTEQSEFPGWREARNCQFYLEEDGRLGFFLLSVYKHDGFTAPEGYVQKDWSTYGYMVLNAPETTITATWWPETGASLSLSPDPLVLSFDEDGYAAVSLQVTPDFGPLADPGEANVGLNFSSFRLEGYEVRVLAPDHSGDGFYDTDHFQGPGSVELALSMDPAVLAALKPGTYEGQMGYDLSWEQIGEVQHPGSGSVTVQLVIPEPQPEFSGHQLVLSGELGMHFYMTLPEGATAQTMSFTVGERQAAAEGVLQSDGRYRFTCYVNSVEMAEPITATYTYTENNAEKTVTDTISVQQYLETLIRNEGNDPAYTAAAPLAKAIYNYGHYAASAVPDGKNHPAMPDTYANDADLITALEGYDISAALVEDVTKASWSLNLDSETAINFYLTTETELTEENVTVMTNDSAATFDYTIEKVGSRYRVQITGIGAHELGTVFIMKTGKTRIAASALSYLQQSLANGSATEATKKAAAALYAYYQAAIAYAEGN